MKNKSLSKATRFSFSAIRIVLLLFTVMGHACAQTIENTRFKGNQGIIPVMKISNLQKDETNPMKIDELKIDIKVLGQIAVTTMEFSYYNTNNRVMEGEFSFPLAEGQTISRFALDMNGTMREGVVVEKEQGRKTFEAIVRRKVDPGLLEMTEGNNFRARVFPLPPKGYRRIIIAFEQELADKGRGYLYQLPLKISDQIRTFSIHAEVIKQQIKFDIEENELSNIEIKQWNDSYIADFKKENYMPQNQLAFMIPYKAENNSVYTEPFSESTDSSYFYINTRPKQLEREKTLPKKIALFWDNSNSCNSRDLEKELLLLDVYIQKIGNLQIELVPFNIQTEKGKIYQITDGNWAELRKALSSIIYDGGTSLGSIDFSKYVCNEILLFSDGMSNFGLFNPTFSNVPVVVINSNTIANHSFLNYIAQRSGSQYINLAKLTAKEANDILTKCDYHFISATITEGEVSEIYPSTPTQFLNSFGVAGILKGKSALLNLNFGFGTTVVYSEKISLSTEKSNNTGLVQRIWAQKKLATLTINEEANKDLITALGKQYGIVTSNTSLIVLENLGDYLQYHIVPPKEMQTDYFKQENQNEISASDIIKNRIDYAAGLFDTRIKWWNKVYVKKEKASVRFIPPSVRTDNEVSNGDTTAIVESYNALQMSQTSSLDEVVVVGNAIHYSSDMSMAVSEGSVNIHAKAVDVSSDKKNEPTALIQLNAWDPQTPYIKVLQYATKGQEYESYLKLKKEYGASPQFYIDASDFFAKLSQKEAAIRILSNLGELKLEEPQLLRILGKKLQLLDLNEEAVNVFEKVLKLKGEEPQSYRDLGLAYDANGQYQLAINSLYEVIKRDWNGRFPEIELIALEELNNIIANNNSKINYSFVDKRLIKNMPIDIRVVLTWDTDNCDMDLWVTDPEGEKCAYNHKDTQIGGLISSDFTQGYGPEEFLLKKASNGQYLVQVNYYGTSSQNLLAPVTLHVSFITNYGKPNQKMQETTIRLENQKDVIDVGKFTFNPLVK